MNPTNQIDQAIQSADELAVSRHNALSAAARAAEAAEAAATAWRIATLPGATPSQEEAARRASRAATAAAQFDTTRIAKRQAAEVDARNAAHRATRPS